ncbi:DUF7144 family membrane protein [Streptomyces broussonetiae]|uniref:DUF7144 domain-containing protein n=1 Tax=Streptomyces broussonetiae TaxID=2686304 RepID=A0ABV5E4X2_9ACTN
MSQPTRPTPAAPEPAGWAAGGTLFAGVLLFVQGVIGILQGIAGIAEDDVYAHVGDYVFEFSLTAWGWIHLVLGVVLVVVAWGLLSGPALWARAAGIALAALTVVANFLYLPYQPWWAVIGIAIGTFVIWSLAHTPSPDDLTT